VQHARNAYVNAPLPQPTRFAYTVGSRWAVGTALCVFAGAAFASGVSFGFVWDDNRIIESSPRMHELSTVYEAFVHPSTWVIGDQADSPVVTYRPLALASMALDYSLWRGDPRGFHLTNLLLHLGCVLVFWRLLLRLAIPAHAAFALALLFGVHPVGAEAITWINGRSEPLCLLFGVWMLVLCARRQGAVPAQSLAAIAVMQCLSLLGKETGVIFMLLALALLASRGDRRTLVRCAGAAAFGLGLYLVLRGYALSGARPGRVSLGTALIAVPALWFRALCFALAPVDLGLENLLAWLATTSAYQRALFLALAVSMLAAVVLLWLRHRTLEAIGLLWWLLMLVPSSSTLATGGYWPGLARWVYVALPGLLLAAAPTLARLSRRSVRVGATTLALLLAWQTQHAIAVWRSNETLLQDMIAKYPSDWYAYFVLARYRLAEHDDAGAVALLRQGTQACGPRTKLSCIEGSTLARMGRCRESGVAFSLGPDCAALASIDAWHALGVCYANQGDFAHARRALSQCETTRPACRKILAQLPE
jgi:hypothetical protein